MKFFIHPIVTGISIGRRKSIVMTKSIALPKKNVLQAHIGLIEEICDANRCSLQVIDAHMDDQDVLVVTITAKNHWDLAEAYFLIGGTIPYQVFRPLILPENLIRAEMVF
jgi:hypothetical protein